MRCLPMLHRSETRYLPCLSPTDPCSLPRSLGLDAPVLVPLRPRRGRHVRGRSFLRRVAQGRSLWGHFCIRDRELRRLERDDPLGLRAAAAARVHGLVTMDVPLYGFMTPGQQARAQALHLHRLLRSLDRAPRVGLDVVPLVKGLDLDTLTKQLDLLHELGMREAAFYAREHLLERDGHLLRRFLRGAGGRKIMPILLGSFKPLPTPWGPRLAVGLHHYVLARKGAWVRPDGRCTPLDAGAFSPWTRRFLFAHDVAGLCDHNYAATERLHGPDPAATNLKRWSLGG